MNVVFEDFVVAALRNELRPRNRRLVHWARGRSLSLDSSGRVRLEPDLSIWDGNRCVFVGDCKYKRVNVAGIKHPDLYQLLAYAIAADLPAGLVVYAAGEADPIVHEIPLAGKHLHIVSLDLSGSPGQLLMEVRGLRALIERHIAGTARSAVDS